MIDGPRLAALWWRASGKIGSPGWPSVVQEQRGFEVATRELHAMEPLIMALKAKLGEGLVALVLFGSRARGRGKGQSDWDVFLVAEGLPENPFDRQLALRALLPTEPWAISLVAKTPQEFEGGFPPLYLDLAVDGIVLYDPRGYMEKKLERIKEIIQRAGLWRSRQKDAFIWKWRKRPPGRWRLDWSGLHGFEGGGPV